MCFTVQMFVSASRFRQQQLERRLDTAEQHCMRCCSAHERQVECVSLDCPHLYASIKLRRQHRAASTHVAEVLRAMGF